MSIANARPGHTSTEVIRFVEQGLGVHLFQRQKQVLTALFDPQVSHQVLDTLLGPEPMLRFAICVTCGRDVHIKKDGTIRKHPNENYASETRVRCDGSGTRLWR
jgi:hypothetical protein